MVTRGVSPVVLQAPATQGWGSEGTKRKRPQL